MYFSAISCLKSNTTNLVYFNSCLRSRPWHGRCSAGVACTWVRPAQHSSISCGRHKTLRWILHSFIAQYKLLALTATDWVSFWSWFRKTYSSDVRLKSWEGIVFTVMWTYVLGPYLRNTLLSNICLVERIWKGIRHFSQKSVQCMRWQRTFNYLLNV